LEDNVNYLRYLAYFIQSSIYIIDWYREKQFVGIEAVFVDKDFVDEKYQ